MEYEEGSGTATADALRFVKDELFTSKNGDRLNVRDIVIFLTDGASTIDRLEGKNRHDLVIVVGDISDMCIGLSRYLDYTRAKESPL